MVEFLRNTEFAEVINGIRDNSEIVILDFNQIPKDIEGYKNIKLLFEECEKLGINAKSPIIRQKFNDAFISKSGKTFLIGRYGEDRSNLLTDSNIAKEGRTIHLGIDIFSSDIVKVFSPEEGEIIRTGFEQGPHSYGNYLIIKHKTNGLIWYSFFGHLSKNLPELGKVKKGEQVGDIGNWKDYENGGWSRHLHYQLLRELPEDGKTPNGYCKRERFSEIKETYPNPNLILKIKAIDRNS